MIHRSPVAPVVLMAIAGTALFAMPGYAEQTGPAQEIQVEASALDVEKWLRSLPLRGLPDLLPKQGLSEHQLNALAALKAEPEFRQFLEEVPDAGRLYFSRYFAWQISTIRDGRSADPAMFAHTIMNDVARLKRFSEMEVVQIGIERDRQFESLLQIAREQFEGQLRAERLPRGAIEDVMETFERAVRDTKLYLTNPASAYCDLPSAPDDMERMRKYQRKQAEAVRGAVTDAMTGSETWRLARLKFAAAETVQRVSMDYANRVAWLEDPKTERPGIITAGMGEAGAFGLFPVEWDRFSYWRSSESMNAGGNAVSGSFEDPEPRFWFSIRYEPEVVPQAED